jgi:AraC-like DNA-binding protein
VILLQPPDLPPRPLTRANAEFRRRFYERWGRENALVVYRAQRIEFAPFTQTLSIKRAFGGSEHYLVGPRRLAVADMHALVLNEGAHYGARIQSRTPVTSAAVFFRPGMADELAAAAAQQPAQQLDTGPDAGQAPCHFAEHLRVLPAAVDAALANLLAGARATQADASLGTSDAGQGDESGGESTGEPDSEAWLEEQLQGLLWAMLRAEPGWRDRSLPLRAWSRSAHAELLSRVDRATDFILSSYPQPITLDDVAGVAALSKYHLVRVFRQVHGVTPMALLMRTRARAAAQLNESGFMPLAEVMALTGFASRQTLFRQLRRHRGAGGKALRRLALKAGERG